MDPVLREVCARNVRGVLVHLDAMPLAFLAEALLRDRELAEALNIADSRLLSPSEVRMWTEGIVAAMLRCKTECQEVMADVRQRVDEALVAEMERAVKEAGGEIPTEGGGASAPD